jgi:hypothetical protein
MDRWIYVERLQFLSGITISMHAYHKRELGGPVETYVSKQYVYFRILQQIACITLFHLIYMHLVSPDSQSRKYALYHYIAIMHYAYCSTYV